MSGRKRRNKVRTVVRGSSKSKKNLTRGHFRDRPLTLTCIMSGHSKWKQIKNKKGAADVKRGKLFSQLGKAITVAARTGQNLDMAVARAKSENMPSDNIQRAIDKGTGTAEGEQISEYTYEAYGPGGSAIMVSVLTDNNNRALADFKLVLKKNDGRFADAGSVQYQFERKGMIEVPLNSAKDRDEVELALIEAGAEDIQDEEDHLAVYTGLHELMTVKMAIEAAGINPTDAKATYVAKMPISLSAEDQEKLLKLMEAIDELDDVESIETNADLSE